MLASMVATEAAGNNRWRRLVRRERELERRPGELRQVERQRERQEWCRSRDEVVMRLRLQAQSFLAAASTRR